MTTTSTNRRKKNLLLRCSFACVRRKRDSCNEKRQSCCMARIDSCHAVAGSSTRLASSTLLPLLPLVRDLPRRESEARTLSDLTFLLRRRLQHAARDLLTLLDAEVAVKL